MTRRIVLGVTGGVAAYKAIEVASSLRKRGHHVNAVLTPAAERFVGALSFAAVTGCRAFTDQDFFSRDGEIVHVELAAGADIVAIVPGSADFIAHAAAGMANSLLLAISLSARCPHLIFPAMESSMWLDAATQDNLGTLRSRGWVVMEPDSGHLASGRSGVGRLPDPERIVHEIAGACPPRDLAGRSILITAGPTREHIDPVRFISNPATARQGIAVATAALARGADVTLVLGPTELRPPDGVEVVPVVSAEEMFRAVQRRFPLADAFIATAAVSDQRPLRPQDQKRKKSELGDSIPVGPTEDILLWAGGHRRAEQVLVGFSAETGDPEKEAGRKLVSKNCDLIVGNDVTADGAGFATDTNLCVFVSSDGVRTVGPATKREIGEEILAFVAERLRP